MEIHENKSFLFLSNSVVPDKTWHSISHIVTKKLEMYSKILHLHFTLSFARRSRVPWDEGRCISDIPKNQDKQNTTKNPNRLKNINGLSYILKISYSFLVTFFSLIYYG